MRWILSFFLFLPPFALPLCAQDDALVGTWETSFTEPEANGTIRLSFGADDRFQLDQVIEVSDSLQAEAGDADLPIVEEFTLQGTGTWRIDGTSLFVELTEVSVYADGREVKDEFNLEEFLVDFPRHFGTYSIDGDTFRPQRWGGISSGWSPALSWPEPAFTKVQLMTTLG